MAADEQLASASVQSRIYLLMGGTALACAAVMVVLPHLGGDSAGGFLSFCLLFLYVQTAAFGIPLLLRSAYWRFSKEAASEALNSRRLRLFPFDLVCGLAAGAAATTLFDTQALFPEFSILMQTGISASVLAGLAVGIGWAFSTPFSDAQTQPEGK